MRNNGGFWDAIGELLAIVLVATYALLIFDGVFNFIDEGIFYDILLGIKSYGSFALVGIVALEAMSGRSFIFKLIMFLLIAVIVLFWFFPDIFMAIIG